MKNLWLILSILFLLLVSSVAIAGYFWLRTPKLDQTIQIPQIHPLYPEISLSFPKKAKIVNENNRFLRITYRGSTYELFIGDSTNVRQSPQKDWQELEIQVPPSNPENPSDGYLLYVLFENGKPYGMKPDYTDKSMSKRWVGNDRFLSTKEIELWKRIYQTGVPK